MVVVNDQDVRFQDVAKVGSRSVAGQKELLSEYFKDAGWESERIVTEMNAAEDFYYDAIAQVKMDKWSRGRVLLLGDSG
jgi:2-polyprenyl-6-methoxyphenol hydroxylase-like FAD-dependent oxidoreductase